MREGRRKERERESVRDHPVQIESSELGCLVKRGVFVCVFFVVVRGPVMMDVATFEFLNLPATKLDIHQTHPSITHHTSLVTMGTEQHALFLRSSTASLLSPASFHVAKWVCSTPKNCSCVQLTPLTTHLCKLTAKQLCNPSVIGHLPAFHSLSILLGDRATQSV